MAKPFLTERVLWSEVVQMPSGATLETTFVFSWSLRLEILRFAQDDRLCA